MLCPTGTVTGQQIELLCQYRHELVTDGLSLRVVHGVVVLFGGLPKKSDSSISWPNQPSNFGYLGCSRQPRCRE
jgi:hypothetical protein